MVRTLCICFILSKVTALKDLVAKQLLLFLCHCSGNLIMVILLSHLLRQAARWSRHSLVLLRLELNISCCSHADSSLESTLRSGFSDASLNDYLVRNNFACTLHTSSLATGVITALQH